MATRGSNFQGPFRQRLSLDVADVRLRRQYTGRLCSLGRTDQIATRQVRYHFRERRRRVNPGARERRLYCIAGGNDDAATGLVGLHDCRQQSRNRPQPAVECEFAIDLDVIEPGQSKLPLCGENAERDREIVTPSRLAHLGRTETDRDTRLRPLESRAHQRAPYAVLAFPHGCLGHANDRKRR